MSETTDSRIWPVRRPADVLADPVCVRAVAGLRRQFGFPDAVFQRAVLPLLTIQSDYLQALPVAGSMAEGGEFGQLRRAFRFGAQALARRQARILPRACAPEDIGALAPRWSHAVFAVAWLRPVAQVGAGLQVDLLGARQGGVAVHWDPELGSMADCGATAYRWRVWPESVRSALAPSDLAWRLFTQALPLDIQAWLREDGSLWESLSALLGAPSAHPDDATLAVLAELADVDSRDAVAVAVPRLNSTGPEAAAVNPPASDAGGESAAPLASVSDRIEPMDSPARQEAAAPMDPLARDVRPGAAGEPDPWPALASTRSLRNDGGLVAFLAWLRDGASHGRLSVNGRDSALHHVADGLLLVSPGLFRQHVRAVSSDGALDARVKTLLRALLRQGWHRRGEDGEDLLAYRWIDGEEAPRGARAIGARTLGRLHGVLLREPARFLDHVPACSTALVRAASTLPPRSQVAEMDSPARLKPGCEGGVAHGSSP